MLKNTYVQMFLILIITLITLALVMRLGPYLPLLITFIFIRVLGIIAAGIVSALGLMLGLKIGWRLAS